MQRKYWTAVLTVVLTVVLTAIPVLLAAKVLSMPHGWKFIIGIPLGLIAHHKCQNVLGHSSAVARRRRAIRETYRRDEQ